MLLCTGVVRVLNVLNPLSLGKVVDSLDETRSFPWKALSFYLVLNFINSSAGIATNVGLIQRVVDWMNNSIGIEEPKLSVNAGESLPTAVRVHYIAKLFGIPRFMLDTLIAQICHIVIIALTSER